MRRILLVGALALLAAALLWVLSEVEVSPATAPVDNPPTTATTTPVPGTDPSSLITDPAHALAAQWPGEGRALDTLSARNAAIWRNASGSVLFAALPMGERACMYALFAGADLDHRDALHRMLISSIPESNCFQQSAWNVSCYVITRRVLHISENRGRDHA